MCISFSQTFFKRIITHFTTPLDPSNDAKLDHSSGTRWPICKQVYPLDSMAIYPKPGHKLLYTHMTGEIKFPTNIPLPCAFHSISSNVDATHAPTRSTNDMIHFISSHDHIGSSILTSLAFHRCLRPSAPSLAQASLPRGPSLQSLQPALHTCNRSIKPSLVLILSTLVTWSLQQIQAIFIVMAWVAHTSVPVH